jgi:alginate O-acetyltransferase complex protein AlgI
MPQLARPFRMKKLMIITGSQYILMGVLSKTVFADNLAVAVDQIFAKPALYDVPTLWLGLVAYTGQVYCDFFGYSLMAVGLARIFGYRMPINFRTSYASLSINELWSRHHITLSNWLRDYLYISLGGNRKGEIRSYLNLMITMVLGGFWHGASWAFVLWGLMHGIAVSINRKWSKPLFGGSGFGKFVGWFLTFWFFVISMLPFRAFDTTTMVTYAKGMLNLNGAKATWMYTPALVLIGILVIWHLLYYFSRPWRKKKLVFQRWGTTASVGFSMAVLFAILMYAQVAQSPFIYFQF